MPQQSRGWTKDAPAAVRPCDSRRFAAQAGAAADPEIVIAAIQAAFTDLHYLTRQGERAAAAGAAAMVKNRVLLLCAIPAASAVRADDKVRLLEIIARRSLSRDPRLTTVLQASQQQERRRWCIDSETLNE